MIKMVARWLLLRVCSAELLLLLHYYQFVGSLFSVCLTGLPLKLFETPAEMVIDPK